MPNNAIDFEHYEPRRPITLDHEEVRSLWQFIREHEARLDRMADALKSLQTDVLAQHHRELRSLEQRRLLASGVWARLRWLVRGF